LGVLKRFSPRLVLTGFIWIMPLPNSFLKTPHHKKSAFARSRPPAPEQTTEQAATMVGIMGRLTEGAL
jgi:hypothetical protein